MSSIFKTGFELNQGKVKLHGLWVMLIMMVILLFLIMIRMTVIIMFIF